MKKYFSIIEDRLVLTESSVRRNELEKHVAAYLENGGTITQVADGVSAEPAANQAKPFVINRRILEKE
jgi:hypothetical protein